MFSLANKLYLSDKSEILTELSTNRRYHVTEVATV